MIDNRDNSKVLELFELYIKGDTSSEEEEVLLEFIRRDQGLLDWIEAQVLSQPNEIDPEISSRMLRNIHDRINGEKVRVAKQVKMKRNIRRIAGIAAILLLPVLSGIITADIVRKQDSQAVASSSDVVVGVEKGQKAKVVLPDGSKVWLNSDSEISYSANFIRERRVELSGEAYFEVEADRSRPFSVLAGDIQVNALGTKFCVKAYPEDQLISATLISGMIESLTPDGNFMQSPDQRLVYNKSTRITSPITNVIAKDYIGWIDNTVRFVNESLEEIAGTVERMYNIKISFDSDEIKKLRFTGTLPNTSLDSILEVISITSPITYRYHNDEIIFSLDNKRSSMFR